MGSGEREEWLKKSEEMTIGEIHVQEAHGFAPWFTLPGYPAASAPEELVHPGLYRRHNGCVDLATIRGPGFGYRLDEIKRQLPEPEAHFER